MISRSVILTAIALLFATLVSAHAGTIFQRVPNQYIASLAAPDAKSGTGAETWGIWKRDPGPRGIFLSHYKPFKDSGGIGPGGWEFDDNDWWLDENGLLMEKPQFPIEPGEYIVTGGREVSAILTVHEKDSEGKQRWELNKDATIYDVTHLECRSARYRPENGNICSPSDANQSFFKVLPGIPMPPVNGCHKQDYTVLIVVAKAVEN